MKVVLFCTGYFVADAGRAHFIAARAISRAPGERAGDAWLRQAVGSATAVHLANDA